MIDKTLARNDRVRVIDRPDLAGINTGRVVQDVTHDHNDRQRVSVLWDNNDMTTERAPFIGLELVTG